MSALSAALMCAGLLPSAPPRTRKMSTTTRLALMCAGAIPIPSVPRSSPDVVRFEEPIERKGLHVKRQQKMLDRRNAIFEFIRKAGRQVTSADVRAEFGICKNMALKDLFALRDSGLIESSKASDGTTWLYEVVK